MLRKCRNLLPLIQHFGEFLQKYIISVNFCFPSLFYAEIDAFLQESL